MQNRIERAGALLDHRLRDHKLADQVDQLIDLLDADADRRGFGVMRCGMRLVDLALDRRLLVSCGTTIVRCRSLCGCGIRCIGRSLLCFPHGWRLERFEETVALLFFLRRLLRGDLGCRRLEWLEEAVTLRLFLRRLQFLCAHCLRHGFL